MTIPFFNRFGLLPFLIAIAWLNLGSSDIPMGNDALKSKKGTIVGTVTFPKGSQFFDNYFFRLKKENGGSSEIRIRSYENINSPTPANKYIKTYLFVIEKEAGNYEINKLRTHASDPGEGALYAKVKDFSIPIHVQEGETVYIGDVLLEEFVKDRLAGFSVSDQFDRDLGYFKEKQPIVDWTNAKKNISKVVYKKPE